MPTPKKRPAARRRAPAKRTAPKKRSGSMLSMFEGMSRGRLILVGAASVLLMVVAYMIGGSYFQTSLFSQNQKNAIVKSARAQIGKPYVLGSTGADSFDCSGLTQYVLKNAVNVSLPRISRDQAGVGRAIEWANLGVGDLVFFDTMNAGRVTHVGVVSRVEGGRVWMINANSVEAKVVEEEVKGYWLGSGRYKGAREITNFTKDTVPATAEVTASIATAPAVPPSTPYTATNGNTFAEVPQSEPLTGSFQ